MMKKIHSTILILLFFFAGCVDDCPCGDEDCKCEVTPCEDCNSTQ